MWPAGRAAAVGRLPEKARFCLGAERAREHASSSLGFALDGSRRASEDGHQVDVASGVVAQLRSEDANDLCNVAKLLCHNLRQQDEKSLDAHGGTAGGGHNCDTPL